MKKVHFSLVLSLLLLSIAGLSSAYPVSLYDFEGGGTEVLMEISGDGTNTVTFNIQVLSPDYADIRGVWFDFLDPFPTSVTATGDFVTGSLLDEDNVQNFGNVTISPLGPFDMGVELGTPGASTDDISSTFFTLTSDTNLFLGGSFAARLTSVGDSVDFREESSKLVSTAPVPEPATMLLLGTGLIGIAGISRRKIKK